LIFFSQSPPRRAGLRGAKKCWSTYRRQANGKRKNTPSLRLPYFAACPAELRVRRGGFFIFSSRKACRRGREPAPSAVAETL